MEMIQENFRDDILSESMDGRRQYNMKSNSNGTVSLIDVTLYDQVGSDFNSAIVNAIVGKLNKFASSSWKPKMVDASTGNEFTCKEVSASGYWVKIDKMLIVSFFWSGKPSKGGRICLSGLDESITSYNMENETNIAISQSPIWYAGGGHLQNNKLDANREFTGWIYNVSDNRIYGRNRNNINIGSDPAGTGGFEEHNSSGDAMEYMSGTIAIQLA